MRIHSCLGLFAISLMLASYAAPAAAENIVVTGFSNRIVSEGSHATQKIYKGEADKLGPVPLQDTIDLSAGADA